LAAFTLIFTLNLLYFNRMQSNNFIFLGEGKSGVPSPFSATYLTDYQQTNKTKVKR